MRNTADPKHLGPEKRKLSFISLMCELQTRDFVSLGSGLLVACFWPEKVRILLTQGDE